MFAAVSRVLNQSLGVFGLKLVRCESGPPSRMELQGHDAVVQAYPPASHLRTAQLGLGESLPRSLTMRCLFVVGNARSGTTILNNCLNHSPDIFMTSEANYYLHLKMTDFVDHYNRMHAEFRNPRSKDSWIPPPSNNVESGAAALLRLARHYCWIGDKVAFGPHGPLGERTHQEAFFEFNSRYFYDSSYLLLIRKPSEVIYSSSKFFAGASLAEMIQTWLDTLLLLLDMHSNLPNTQWVFFEDLTESSICVIAKRLSVSLTLPDQTIRTCVMYSKLDGDEVHPSIAHYEEIIRMANSLYRDLKIEILKPHIKGATNGLFRSMSERVAAIRDKLMSRKSGKYDREQWLSPAGAEQSSRTEASETLIS